MRARPSIVPFEPAHLEGAAEALAARHRRHRLVEPGLDPRYEDAVAAAAEVEQLLTTDGASGVVALSGETVVGFLVGTPLDPIWGANVWVQAAGHAVAEPELVRHLYAAAAERWVAEGATSHYAMVPATDSALVDAWFRLGFGHQHAHAIREPASVGETPVTSDGLVVRRVRRDDLDELARVERALPEHQALAPVFSRLPVPTLDEVRAELDDDLDNPAYTTFVAERAGRVVGSATGCALEVSSMHRGLARPDRAAFLGFAAVLPEHRSTGAGRALGEAILGWACDEAYESVVTDWRMTNLLASRTWPALGFRPTLYRLHRAIA